MGGASLAQFRVATTVTRALPRRALPSVSRIGGALGARVAAGPRAMLERHLARVSPELTELELAAASRAGIESYARYWVETLRLGSLGDDAIADGFRTEGYDPYITDGLQAGRGVILALPHLGGWEWAGRWLGQQGHPVSAVVERLEPPEVYEWFAALRRRIGINVIPLGPTSGREVLAALARNEVVALLCDRDLGRNGVEVSFFGAPTTLPAGPMLLARRSGAPVLPTAVYFTDRPDGHLALVGAPIEPVASTGRLREQLAADTQRLAHRIEELIRRAPEQWHLLQPNWPDDPGYSDLTSNPDGGVDGTDG